MNRVHVKLISILSLSVLLCACTYRTLEYEEPRYFGDYLSDLSLERSSPTGDSNFSMMKISDDYFVRWRGGIYMVPEGMSTDFASIPSRVRTMLSIYQATFDWPLGDDDSLTDSIGRWTEPAVIHDAAYDDKLELVFVEGSGRSTGDKLILDTFLQRISSVDNEKVKKLIGDLESPREKTKEKPDERVARTDEGETEEKEGDEIRANSEKIFSKEPYPVRESVLRLFLEEIVTKENLTSTEKRDRFMSSATIYALDSKNRIMLDGLNLDRGKYYCKRRSCIDNRETVDHMFGHFLYASKVTKWVIWTAVSVLDTFGSWKEANPNPITPNV